METSSFRYLPAQGPTRGFFIPRVETYRQGRWGNVWSREGVARYGTRCLSSHWQSRLSGRSRSRRVRRPAPPRLLTKFPEASATGVSQPVERAEGPRRRPQHRARLRGRWGQQSHSRVRSVGCLRQGLGLGRRRWDPGPADLRSSDAGSVPSAITVQDGDQWLGSGAVVGPERCRVDGDGAVYVFEKPNLRVQKFSPAGEFLRCSVAGSTRRPARIAARGPTSKRATPAGSGWRATATVSSPLLWTFTSISST